MDVKSRRAFEEWSPPVDVTSAAADVCDVYAVLILMLRCEDGDNPDETLGRGRSVLLPIKYVSVPGGLHASSLGEPLLIAEHWQERHEVS